MIILLTCFSQYKFKPLTPAVSTPVTCKAKPLILFMKCENEDRRNWLHVWKEKKSNADSLTAFSPYVDDA